jgi:hypothetical protein
LQQSSTSRKANGHFIGKINITQSGEENNVAGSLEELNDKNSKMVKKTTLTYIARMQEYHDPEKKSVISNTIKL